jgi:YbgC/YbaW family acyl-CoA thioester hydrolase
MIFKYKRMIFGYECDIYGHLNNAAYQHILEEARSAALDIMQLPLTDLADKGIQIFLKRIMIEYIRGIPFGKEILINSRIVDFNRVKSLWFQEITDHYGKLLAKAEVTGVFVKEGKPLRVGEEITNKLKDYRESLPL